MYKLFISTPIEFKKYCIETNKYNQDKLKNEIEINQRNYEKLIDSTADEISSFVEKATLEKLS